MMEHRVGEGIQADFKFQRHRETLTVGLLTSNGIKWSHPSWFSTLYLGFPEILVTHNSLINISENRLRML